LQLFTGHVKVSLCVGRVVLS